ncbi:MAG: hypothetical protein KGZ53_05610 [Peptococcaceae bacterium]|nr:hypothetical protein [Peptococcaceae bacterium]
MNMARALLQGLKGREISATYISPELTLCFQARVETVLETATNEVALLLSQGGRIIATGAGPRASGNGLILDIAPGKKLYLNDNLPE